MQIILLIQIAVFLFISPIVMSVIGEGVPYVFGAAVLFLCAFLVGLQLGKSRASTRYVTNLEFVPQLSPWIKLFFAGWTVLYILVVISNDLVFRRQGSHEMAVIYSSLPLSNLIVLRGYEVAFYPATLAMIASLLFDKGKFIRITIFVMFSGFLFMGVADSRAKLLMPILFYYMIFLTSRGSHVQPPKKILYLSGLVLFFAALIIGASRVADFDGIFEYLVQDLIKRTDGLELISLINQEVSIPIQGTLDFRIFINFIAMVPFITEAEALKALGLTSSKNYLLREILVSDAFDMNNSVIADLFYFGGYIGVAIGAIIYGYFVGKFNAIARSAAIWENRSRAAFLLAFMMNCFRIEVDFFSMIISTTRDFLIIYLVFLMFRFVSNQVYGNSFVRKPFANLH